MMEEGTLKKVILTINKDIEVNNLEKLIEECGEDFRTLILHTQFNKKLEKPWEAVPNKKRRPNSKSKKGATPLEAVKLLRDSLIP